MPGTIIEALRDYFKQCPLMQGGRLNINFLPEEQRGGRIEYDIAPTPTETRVKRYMSRSQQEQYSFSIRSLAEWGADTLLNIENSGFYEELAAWLKEQSDARNLPELPTGMTALKIDALSPGYLFTVSPNTGKYQIQCRLLYFKKGARRNEII